MSSVSVYIIIFWTFPDPCVKFYGKTYTESHIHVIEYISASYGSTIWGRDGDNGLQNAKMAGYVAPLH